ncbi:type IX secretion system membrane protein PorP/SprF, partial [bacterium]|nr:type IX secretion system membrane protein PorP/SprF [bacterium]
KFIRFQIDSFSESAVAADFGAVYTVPSEQLYVGAGVFNVGTTTSAFIESKDDLPLNFQFGVSKQLEHLPLWVSGALVKYKGDSVDFRIGGEFTLTEQLFLRLGYNSVGQDQQVSTDKDRFAGAAVGLGFKLTKWNIDYSFSSFGEVGSLNRISLVGRF